MIFVRFDDGRCYAWSSALRSWALPFEFLSDEQVARYGRFPEEPSVAELEQFFRLDSAALDALADKRSPATRLGGPFSGHGAHARRVPDRNAYRRPGRRGGFRRRAARHRSCLSAEYGRRAKTAYEHAWQIRELLGYRDFGACEAEVRAFVAARTWASAEGLRALFDRARVHLLRERILLPGITVLTRLVGEVRKAENHRLHALLSGRLSAEMRQAQRRPGADREAERARAHACPAAAGRPGVCARRPSPRPTPG